MNARMAASGNETENKQTKPNWIMISRYSL